MRPTNVLIVDDHPALRAGLRTLLEHEPGLRCVATVAGEREMMNAVHTERPDVVVLDYALRDGDGLSACFRLKQRPDAPAVVLYSAYADDVLAVPATVAQADAIVSKSAPVEELLDAIDTATRGESMPPQPDPEVMHAASSRLREDDLPVLGMLFARVPVGEIAEILDTTPADIRARGLRVIGQMQATDRVSSSPAAGLTPAAV